MLPLLYAYGQVDFWLCPEILFWRHFLFQYFREQSTFGDSCYMHCCTMTSALRHFDKHLCSEANTGHFNWLHLAVITLLQCITARVHIRLKGTTMKHSDMSSTDEETFRLKPGPISRTRFTPCHLNSGHTGRWVYVMRNLTWTHPVCKWVPALTLVAMLCSEQCSLRGIIVFLLMKIRPKLEVCLDVKLCESRWRHKHMIVFN